MYKFWMYCFDFHNNIDQDPPLVISVINVATLLLWNKMWTHMN